MLDQTVPRAVTVYEVGPRDGLQNEPETVPAAVKLELIERLAAAGLPAIEATSFVHPKWVPQLADAEQVARALTHGDGPRYPVLVPNDVGLRRAIEAGVREIAIFGSATESFARRNLNRGVDESLEMFRPVVEQARATGLRVRGYVSMAWGDPWEGAVPAAQVAGVSARMWALGLDELSLGDTIGVATPLAVQRVLGAVAHAVPAAAVAVHFHDTYGQALANVLAALDAGVTIVDSAVGGLGGCPYARSATGNLATEDLVYMLDGLGVRTGVDLDAVVEAAWWIAGRLGRSPGHVARALRPARRVSPDAPFGSTR
jgi:hydroxymethylglutaryl-CoA lyase